MKPALKEEYEQVTYCDTNYLKELVSEASKSTFTRQLLQSKVLEMHPRAYAEGYEPRNYPRCILF